jgi:hypothetical protein
VYGPDGTPLHSWRVLLLPYIENQKLYDEFHLGEPWDSPHNLRLLERMPSTYAPPGYKKSLVPPNHTICHVFVGKGTAFEGPKGLRFPGDFPDGTSNTLMVVEAGEPVPWTRPEEIVYDPAGPLPRLRGFFKDGFRACMADGSTRWVRYGTSEEALRAAITRNGGETIDLDQ